MGLTKNIVTVFANPAVNGGANTAMRETAVNGTANQQARNLFSDIPIN